MRRVFPVALLSVLVAVSSAAFAQPGNAGHGAGASSGFHGSFSASRSFSGSTSFAGRGYAAGPPMTFATPHSSMLPAPASAYVPAYGADHRGAGRYRGPFQAPYSGYGYGGYVSSYAYANSWELLPGGSLSDDDDTQNAQPPAADQAVAPQPDTGGPEFQAAPAWGYRQEYEPPAYAAPVSPSPIAPEPQLTLIFRDGHTQQIRNYVVTPHAVIVMDEAASGREPSIPLTEINLPATEEAARQAGLEFSPPVS